MRNNLKAAAAAPRQGADAAQSAAAPPAGKPEHSVSLCGVPRLRNGAAEPGPECAARLRIPTKEESLYANTCAQ